MVTSRALTLLVQKLCQFISKVLSIYIKVIFHTYVARLRAAKSDKIKGGRTLLRNRIRGGL